MSKVVHASSTDFLSSLDAVPAVPADRAEVFAQAEAIAVSGRFPEANRAEGILGLREILARLARSPNELGDLGPDGAECGQLADGIDHATRAIARFEALAEYLRAWRTVREARASKRIDLAYAQVTQRVELGRLQADAYGNVRAFVEARGQAIADGIARAKAAKKTPETP